MSKFVIIAFCYFSLLGFSSCGSRDVTGIRTNGKSVTLENEWTSFKFNLAQGTYNILDKQSGLPVISDASLRVNDWKSDTEGQDRVWAQRKVTNEFGEGIALDLEISGKDQPSLLFSFILYDEQHFIEVTTSVRNTFEIPIQIKDIYVLEDGELYKNQDLTEDFAMIDGFSGGEPLEYGKRKYSPLTRRNALKSRNNILLTFKENDQRNILIMGGLTYKDFEKYATIEQARRVELLRGKDGKESLLSYLNLPVDTVDQDASKESLILLKGKNMRKWQYHEFYCSEAATTAFSDDEIVVQLDNLNPDGKYNLGFSWWRSLWHGNRKDHFQSVFIEYTQNGETKQISLLENQILPLFDGVKKDGIEQVEMLLPAEAIKAGSASIHVRHADWSKIPKELLPAGQTGQVDANVYLSEIWLRDGVYEPFLSNRLTALDNSPRPRREFRAQLFASDPVGKRIDPGQTYVSEDRFYINIVASDPFEGLEKYGLDVQKAQKVELSMYDFPSVCLWYAENGGYGGGKAKNTTQGAVNEMTVIKNKGFLNYSRAAVRLVPDSYMPVNQQGWWDDEHWQRKVEKHNGSKNGVYVKPYETSEKWGNAVTDLGGIPLTYFQAGFRSEDYAQKFPEHMLFNKTYAWKGKEYDIDSELFNTWNQTWSRNGKVWAYDYTDPGFISHLEQVYRDMKKGGIKGLMFDYPASGRASGGGMEDAYSTTAAAYRNIFQFPHDGLGPNAYVHERNMEKGSDVSIGLVASMRTENDTDRMDGTTVTRCGLRWYKNRVLYNQDTDSKNIVRLQGNRDEVRGVLTMAYVTTGRFLLANSFSQFSDDTYYDVTRTFPYHTEYRSARPIDAFVSDMPHVYDYEVNESWHQVTFYNSDFENEQVIGIDIAGDPIDGALDLDPQKSYLIYDFWNDNFCGVFDGESRVEQTLRPGEARMLSLREKENHPQVISTNRHIMQGYLDMTDVKWDPKKKELSGTSKVVAGDEYVITVANNGFDPITENIEKENEDLSKITINRSNNETVKWSIIYN